jgi:hypothetical protein
MEVPSGPGARWPKPAGASAIRHPDVVEYLRQAGIVEGNRRVEHCEVPGLQMVRDEACLGVPDLRRREQGLLTVDALDGVDHSVSSEPLPRWPWPALEVGMEWMAVIAIVSLVQGLPVSVT